MEALSIALLGLILLFCVALALTGFLHLVIFRVPYVPTPMPIARQMVQMAYIRPGETIYDLGAGDARLLLLAMEDRTDITSIGLEVVPTIWLLGKLRVWWSGKPIVLRMRNLLSQNLRDADVIFLYVMPHLMKKLEAKFTTELRKGTRIICHSFAFPGREPSSVIRVPWRGGERVLRLYEW